MQHSARTLSNVKIPIIPGMYPDVETCGIVFGHKDVDGLLEFVFEVDNFMVTIQLEQAIEHIADCVLVVHQDAESRRVFGQQKFFAMLVCDDVFFLLNDWYCQACVSLRVKLRVPPIT